MPDALTSALDRVVAWAGRPVIPTQIKGGLSHRILRLDTEDGDRWLLRVLDPRVSAAGLGIPLDLEIVNTTRAAETGVGARVLLTLPGAVLLEYIDGPTLDAPAVRDPAMAEGIAEACRRLHAGPRFATEFSIFRKQEELLALCRRHGLGTPAGYEDRLPAVAEIEDALAARPPATVPCHNDLLPENFILDGTTVRIVDYQLSGNNDPAFELGDIAAEADFEPDMVDRLTRAYFGDEDPAARVRLHLIMSNITWTLWFSVHHGLLAEHAAAAGFDYEAEAADKFAQAVRDLDDPGFGSLMDAVRGRRPSRVPRKAPPAPPAPPKEA
ncbi:phosphotransferase [Sphaerisporangium sp. TRM90804]|uniref:phosphotransferase n=1 Tax=Sphaerisporangium sp. TRM90804 TaxID=3031113 RepID=UPI00244B11B2|nr:phosphotransferase [Sphaerisporangium sp. TRM90804]MDH2429926.1 phosphotransferase [Sphaerisporangium sp. TRM90804]